MEGTPDPSPQRRIEFETVERDLMRCSQDFASLLGTLQARRTKTLGQQLREQLTRVVDRTKAIVETHFSDQASILRTLQMLRWDYARETRFKVIEDINAIIQELNELRIAYSRWQLSDYKQRISQLQFRLDTQRASDDSREGESQLPPESVRQAKSVFVIMPFNEQFTDVWSGGILKAARIEGFDAIRADMINRSTDITEDIIEAISICRIAIVDVTGNNPNVMFELGYAMAKRKPQIIISQSAEFLPFDIRNIRTIVYKNTWAGIEDLSKRLGVFLRNSMGTRRRRRRR